MGKLEEVDWTNIYPLLLRYKSTNDPMLGNMVFAFLHLKLSQMIPLRTRRSGGEDAVQELLKRLLEKKLDTFAPDVKNAQAWFRTCLQRQGVSIHRKSKLKNTDFLETDVFEKVTASASCVEKEAIAWESAKELEDAMAQINAPSRSILRLLLAPENLSESELGWLSEQMKADVAVVRKRALEAAGDPWACSFLVDPPVAGEEDDRRKRLERFRKRRARARDELESVVVKMREAQ